MKVERRGSSATVTTKFVAQNGYGTLCGSEISRKSSIQSKRQSVDPSQLVKSSILTLRGARLALQKYANVNALKLTEAVKTKIYNIAKLPTIHAARQLQAALRICGAKPIQSLTTIIKAVSDTYAYRKIPACPPLTLNRKLKRLAWARHHQLEQTNWAAIVFTDEKKFNLDGPDGFHKTWVERAADVLDIWSRHSSAGGCMVWGEISARGKIHLHFIEGLFTAAKYVSMLRENNVLSRCRQMVGPNMVFQQDNAPVHTSRLVKNFMNDENVELLDWPAYSPDFNIIENL
ncbi:Transposable element Tc3 transposase [Porphyridium purpureum]|uniref:Transposable element Tc3 transposase n=1 Tax=Porphyridium purpureum TaxID=35688 RepID=A0A5J4YWV7_PORPP|nr:Transposable element Tc3 transposase [Porphyridium purpureum]|eukprot:POR8383..scf227_4